VTEHPGTIEFVDAATGEVTRTVPVDEVPEGIAFVRGRRHPAALDLPARRTLTQAIAAVPLL
jgi:hypothetical protein